MRLTGKTALVTGAASGLGEAISRRYSAEGACVIVADIDVSGGMDVANAIGPNAQFVRLDVTQPDDWQAAMKLADNLDVIVNNAGITTYGSIEEVTLEQFRHEFEIDVMGVFLGCQAAVAKMKPRGGSIINMSSLCGIRAQAELIAYSSAKAAVTHMTKSIAKHCAVMGHGIRCNSIHPGVIHTAILDKVLSQVEEPEQLYASMMARHPVGRVGTPDEVAEIAVYLASDASAFTTGAEFCVDGGASI